MDAFNSDLENADQQLDEDDMETIAGAYGCKVHESSDGFIALTWYTSREKYERAENEVMAIFEESEESEEESWDWDDVESALDGDFVGNPESELGLCDVAMPDCVVRFCESWHSGMDSLFYAVSSTGGLTLGTIRPRDDDGEPMSDRAWHVSLWEGLSGECSALLRELSGGRVIGGELSDRRARGQLAIFERYCDRVVAQLRAAYGMEE
jgi:hypothetical protein